MKTKRKQLHEMNVDEFMAGGFSSSDDSESPQVKKRGKRKNEMKQKENSKKKSRTNIIKTSCDEKEQEENESDKKKINIDEVNASEFTDDNSCSSNEEFEQNSMCKSNRQGIVKCDMKNQLVIKKKSKTDKIKKLVDENELEINDSSSNDDEFSETDEKGLQKAMGRLKEKDPDFFQFLEENDKKLLDFAASDEDEEQEDDKMEQDDISDNEISSDLTRITRKLLDEWEKQLQDKPDLTILRKILSGFKAAVQQASGEEMNKYKVDDSEIFNGVVKVCLTHVVPALHKFLKLPDPVMSKTEKKFDPTKCKGWKKISGSVKSYLGDIIKLSTVVSEPAIVSALLKHVLYLIPFYLAFVKMSRFLLKKIIVFWCTGEETVRVLAFLSIIRLVRSLPEDYLDYTLKQMYLEYVKNCKFTSPSTWPLINFMKRALVELYLLNESLAYQHAFVYIRQLSIHLRNAVTVKKKDAFQAVYNWQYVHCLLLWIHLLSTLPESSILKPLIYPLTQTIIGTIKLIPTSKYLPLRFHLVRGLIRLSNDTNIFIPILPLIFEAMDIVDFKKKHTSLSMKPLDFDCALKLSKSQLQENGFKDKVIDQVYELLLEYLSNQAYTIGFPELTLPTVVHIKSFIKTCKISTYCRKLKQLIDKIQENSTVIIDKRKQVTFKLCDNDAIKHWESEVKQQGTPLQNFYDSWKKSHGQATKPICNNDNDDEND